MPIPNNARRDPTRTVTLRNRFASAISQRFIALRAAMRRLIIEENFLGAEQKGNERNPLRLAQGDWEYRWAEEKLVAFLDWLNQKLADGVLETFQVPGIPGRGEVRWTDTYLRSAYQKGMAKATNEVSAVIGPVADYTGVSVGALPVLGVFNFPIHADRVRLIYTRVFSDLVGVTDAMAAQMRRELALGMARGSSPEAIAHRLANRIDKIGITRGRLIARTEIVHTHNLGKLNEYERFEGILGEEVDVRWLTAADEKVRSTHRPRHNRIYTRQKAESMLGEPNCRCTIVPYVESLEQTITEFQEAA